MAETQFRPEQTQPITSQPVSETSSLWHDAYKHDKGWALAGLGAAAFGTALLGVRGAKVAEALLEPSALVVEDTAYVGKGLKLLLQEQGFKVTWLTSVSKGNPLIGLAEDGTTTRVNVSKMTAALVDGDLGTSSALQGPDVIKAIADKVPTIGTSTTDDLNLEMLQNGANAAARKGVILTALSNHQLDLRLATKDLQSIQPTLDRVAEQLKTPEGKQMRSRANDILEKFM